MLNIKLCMVYNISGFSQRKQNNNNQNVMAKSDTVESEPTATGAELKKELQKLLKAIADDDDDDNNLEAIDRAQTILCCLKELKVETCAVSLKKLHHEGSCGSVPEEFKCPLSMELMAAPVIIASGQVSISISLF